MIVHLEHDAPLPEFGADVCIVGAGAAGIVLAAELVRQGLRVLLLESGGVGIEPAAQELNACFYAGQQHRGAHVGRVRALGGTTTVWGGQVLELDEEDFAARTWIPGSGWPFQKSELQPYYGRALVAEGLASVLRSDAEVWRKMKTEAPPLGAELETYFTHWCPEPNFARLYGNLLNSPNLCAVLHATAIAMMLSQDGTRVEGVRCRTATGRNQDFSAGQYVFCLGTIETTRFLLQPIPGTQVAPWNQSGLLGKHFQSHIDYNAAAIPAREALRLRGWFANAYLGGYKYHPKFRLAKSVQKRLRTLNIAGSLTCINPAETELRQVKRMVRNILHRRDSEMSWHDFPRIFRQLRTMMALGYGYRVQHRAWWPQESAFWLRVHCEQEPLSQSSITLTDVRDASGLLQAKVDWRVSPLEWRTIQSFTEQAEKTFAAMGATGILQQTELKLEEGFRSVVFDNSHHHIGGTRMAISPTEGVVDPNLKLHGLENGYVCSASVFPTGGYSNPTHTVIALAIRLADYLTGRQTAAGLRTEERPGA